MSQEFRREQKYIIPVEEFTYLQPILERYMRYDKYSGPKGYQIRSLYFDSIFDQDLYANLDGNEEKHKIRLRLYNYNDHLIKLELKSKFNVDGSKKVIMISREEANRMINSDYSFLKKYQSTAAFQIYQRLVTGGYRPKTIVEYHRKTLVFPASNVRIAFDTNIRSGSTPFTFLSEHPALVPAIQFEQGILEIKYNQFIPGIIKASFAGLNLTQTAFSKYTISRQLF